MDHLKVTSIWDLTDAARPALLRGLRRADDAAEAESICAYLGSGRVVLKASGLRADRLDPSRASAVPLGFATDGTWIWPLELEYYLRVHGVLPEDEFVEHMQEHAFKVPDVSDDAAAQALLIVRGE